MLLLKNALGLKVIRVDGIIIRVQEGKSRKIASLGRWQSHLQLQTELWLQILWEGAFPGQTKLNTVRSSMVLYRTLWDGRWLHFDRLLEGNPHGAEVCGAVSECMLVAPVCKVVLEREHICCAADARYRRVPHRHQFYHEGVTGLRGVAVHHLADDCPQDHIQAVPYLVGLHQSEILQCKLFFDGHRHRRRHQSVRSQCHLHLVEGVPPQGQVAQVDDDRVGAVVLTCAHHLGHTAGRYVYGDVVGWERVQVWKGVVMEDKVDGGDLSRLIALSKITECLTAILLSQRFAWLSQCSVPVSGQWELLLTVALPLCDYNVVPASTLTATLTTSQKRGVHDRRDTIRCFGEQYDTLVKDLLFQLSYFWQKFPGCRLRV